MSMRDGSQKVLRRESQEIKQTEGKNVMDKRSPYLKRRTIERTGDIKFYKYKPPNQIKVERQKEDKSCFKQTEKAV